MKDALKIGMFVVSILALWIAVAFLLWGAYDFDAIIHGGACTRQSAVTWVCEFAAILSVVVAAVWAFLLRNVRRDVPIWRTAWEVFWCTCLGLFIYAVIILARRYTWSQARGQDDWAMFFGHVNARFFSETGPLSFLLEILPAASLISTVFFVAQTACLRRLVRSPNKTAVPNE